jgi:Holliday junction resolvase RusA-like endonuclease
MQQIFEAILKITPQTWKRTEGGRHMPKRQRAYYYALYAEMFDTAGMRPVAKDADLKMEVTFYNSDGVWRDASNLLKGFEDAGQPSHWVTKKDVGYVDFWDDKQFSDIRVRRVMHAYVDQITVKIWEL